MTKRFLAFSVMSIFCAALFIVPGIASAGSCLYAIESPGCSHGLPIEQDQALLAKIAADPAPNLQSIAVDAPTVKQYSQPPAHLASTFRGVLIGHPLPFPMAFMVTSIRPSPVPGWDSAATLPVIPRYCRVNCS